VSAIFREGSLARDRERGIDRRDRKRGNTRFREAFIGDSPKEHVTRNNARLHAMIRHVAESVSAFIRRKCRAFEPKISSRYPSEKTSRDAKCISLHFWQRYPSRRDVSLSL